MKTNSLGSEQAALVGVIDPDANGAGALSTAWVDMKNFDQLMAIALAGTLGTAATLDAKFEQATNSGGTGVKDVTGKAITQLVKASNDDNQAIINLRAEELDVNGGFSFARVTATVGAAASDTAVVVLGLGASYGPASDHDLASVVEIVN